MEPQTKFGIGQLGSPTPNWAKMVFKVTVIVTTVAVFVISGTTLMSTGAKMEATLWLKGVDMLALGFSQLFGVPVEKPKLDE